jgi:hypothetical protein
MPTICRICGDRIKSNESREEYGLELHAYCLITKLSSEVTSYCDDASVNLRVLENKFPFAEAYFKSFP